MKLEGQGEAYARVLRGARALRLHHGLVVEGPRGSGKSSAVAEIAQALLCESGDGDAPCLTCRVCRLVASGEHAGVHRLGVPEGKQDVSVDQVRDLQATLGRTAMEGRARVVLVDPADRLTEQAQNALLKTLEEPGDRTFLLLASGRPEYLLETVRSRTDRLRLATLSEETVSRLLAADADTAPEQVSLAVRLARGSVGLARDLVRAGVEARHPRVVAFLDAPSEMSPLDLARELLEGAGDRADADRRARLVLRASAEEVRQRLASALASSPTPAYVAAVLAPWVAVLELLQDAEADLDLRIGAQQVLAFAFLRARSVLVPATSA